MEQSVERPFKRTKCGCASCVMHCRRQPGFLVPGDLERITAELRATGREAEIENFVASPGAVIGNRATGKTQRVPTITPARKPDGSCAFLDDAGRCTIHEVAPFGCAYYDDHNITTQEANRRTLWALKLIMDTPNYALLRGMFPEAERWDPIIRI